MTSYRREAQLLKIFCTQFYTASHALGPRDNIIYTDSNGVGLLFISFQYHLPLYAWYIVHFYNSLILKENFIYSKQNRISECHKKDAIRDPPVPSLGSNFESFRCYMFIEYSTSFAQSNYCFLQVLLKLIGNIPDTNYSEVSGFLWSILRVSGLSCSKEALLHLPYFILTMP